MRTSPSPRPFRPQTPAASSTPAPRRTPPPSFRIDREVQPGDTVDIVSANSTWTFIFHDPITVSTLSPSAVHSEIEDRVSKYVISKRSMTTSNREANDNQPPGGPMPQQCITKGQPVFFKNWRSDDGGDMRTGDVIELWHNGSRIF